MKTSWKSSGPSQTTLPLDTTARDFPPFCGWVCWWQRPRPEACSLSVVTLCFEDLLILKLCSLQIPSAALPPAHAQSLPSSPFSGTPCFSRCAAIRAAPWGSSSLPLEWGIQKEPEDLCYPVGKVEHAFSDPLGSGISFLSEKLLNFSMNFIFKDSLHLPYPKLKLRKF